MFCLKLVTDTYLGKPYCFALTISLGLMSHVGEHTTVSKHCFMYGGVIGLN